MFGVRVGRGWWGIGASIVMIALAGCGGSGPSRPSLPLNAYLIRGHEEPGYTIDAGLTRVDTAANFVGAGRGDGDAASQLAHNGFRQALVVHLSSQTGAGLSTVLQLASVTDAEHEQRGWVSAVTGTMRAHGDTVQQFSVVGVPGAIGLAGGPAANTVFREGRCILLVGAQSSAGRRVRSATAAGSQRVYVRTHEHRGVCSG